MFFLPAHRREIEEKSVREKFRNLKHALKAKEKKRTRLQIEWIFCLRSEKLRTF
jgi:hypothetical protein